GHLPNLCTMAWIPPVFLAIDMWIMRRDARAVLLGIAAVAMQIFAGHPQYVFYGAIGAGLYGMVRLAQADQKMKCAWGLLSMYPGGAALAAVQLLTAVQASGETVRQAHLPWDFVAMFGFPPENILTMFAPHFFGTLGQYWGR